MAKWRKETIGTGMDAEVRYWCEGTPAEKADALKSDLRALAVEWAGLSPCEISMKHAEEWARERLHGLDAEAVLVKNSPEDYARRILRHASHVRELLRHNDEAVATLNAERARALFDRIQIKLAWERPAMAGVKSLEGAKEGGRIRGEQQQREKAERDCIEAIRGCVKVSDIIASLALEKDELGDYLNPKDDLWNSLFGRLDELCLHPSNIDDDQGNPIKITYVNGNGNSDEIKFSSFRTMIYTERKKYK